MKRCPNGLVAPAAVPCQWVHYPLAVPGASVEWPNVVGCQEWRVDGETASSLAEFSTDQPSEIVFVRIEPGTWHVIALGTNYIDVTCTLTGKTWSVRAETQPVDPAFVHLTVKANGLSGGAGNYELPLQVGELGEVQMSWTYGGGYPGYPQVPVIWTVPAGLNVEFDPATDRRSIVASAQSAGTYLLEYDVAGVARGTIRVVVSP